MLIRLRQARESVEVVQVADVTAAKHAWLLAVHQFNQVTEPGKIDEAIYRCLAAERHFINLLKTVPSTLAQAGSGRHD